MLMPRISTGPVLILVTSAVILFLISSLKNVFSLSGVALPRPQSMEESSLLPICKTGSDGLGVTHLLKEHRYMRDGLLEVNEDGRHPIYELIARAEAAWEEKVKAASKTLPEAVREYRRRYGRAPPLGFDSW